jgi:serine/threonine-protein kinase
MITCSSCGHSFDDALRFCGRCGAPARTQVGAPALASAVTAPGGGPPGAMSWSPTEVVTPGGPAQLPPVASATPPVSSEPLSPRGATEVLSPTTDPHGPSWGPASGLFAGSLFDGKYRIERQLGAGGMSVVYLATEVTVDMPVVIKALLPHFASQAGFRERLLREARALARIDHPNVVRLRSVVAAAPDLCVVMEYVEGEDLAGRLARWATEGRPGIDATLAMFQSIVSGVEAAHQEGIVHRDIKPSNVLVRSRDGRLKVTDFGIAKSLDETDKQLTHGMIGTMYYMAPEQLRADPSIDTRADIYALGILLFEMLTGTVPFNAASAYEIARQHIQDPLPSLRARAHWLPDDPRIAALDMLLGRACAKQREARHASCAELREGLDRVLSFGPQGRSAQPAASGYNAPREAGPSHPPGHPPGLLQPAGPSHPPAPLHPSGPSLPASPPTDPLPASLAAPTGPLPGASRAPLWPKLVGLALVGMVVAGFFVGDPPSIFSFLSGTKPRHPHRPAPTIGPAPTAAPTTASSAAHPGHTTTAATAAVTAAAGHPCVAAGECPAADAPRNATPTCSHGQCSFSCNAGFFDCGTACLDLAGDARHCGSCSGPGSDCTTLGAGARCVAGRCEASCPGGGERCGKVCCAAGARCEAGRCESAP